MGIVDLDCIASNPNSTILYAIGNAENSRGEVVATLFRSNSNPANATDIKWAFLPYYSSHSGYDTWDQPHYKYSRFGDVDCAVSSSGEFTAFFYNPQFSITGSARMVPMGILFYGDVSRPILNIYGSMMYGWTSQNFVHQSFYIEKDGVETVVHAVMDETASVIRFGLVDKDSGYLQLAAIWKLVDGRFMVGELTDKFPTFPTPKTTSYGLDYSPAPNATVDQRHMIYMNGSLYLYSDTTASTTITNSTTRIIGMSPFKSFKETRYLQAIGGRLPGQVPFAVSLTPEGYYGITLEGPLTEPSLEYNSSIIEGAEIQSRRSRFRNYDNQVLPGYYIYQDRIELSAADILGIAIGAIIGLFILFVYCAKLDRWLKKIRLDDEKRAAVDLESFELISRLRHVSGHYSSNPPSTPPPGETGVPPFDAISASTTSHTLLDGLGLTRHPRPNTVIVIRDDDDEPVRTRVDRDTQQ
ncbi:hypothetical protein BGZ96_003870 [Linnemannia gamsii]|uniref:Acid protease n=1 Tax=Linnemannia gamsii TaxID=64522 RepID=A0ABQ7K7M6_9FUNG|nr:hypothetical protein BGZ96_003870 [Linnemannia gamsii]